tara:strand:+ start:179 stop:1012 length:834 start_codon:yes stop_codon:yes gene_type:complete
MTDGIKRWTHTEFPDLTMVECKPHAMGDLVTSSRYAEHVKFHCQSVVFCGTTYEGLKSVSERGHLESVTKAREFAKNLRRTMPHTGSVPVTLPSVCGGGLSVPTYLAGNPQCFGLPEYKPAATEPVTLWVALNAWGSITAGEVAKRSMCVLGLASLVDEERPINLNVYQYSHLGGSKEACVMYPLGVRPVDWAMAGALLGHTGMYRGASFGVISKECGEKSGDIMFGKKDRRKVLRMKDDDIHVGVWKGEDARMEPEDWVKRWYEKLERKAMVGGGL